MKIYTRTVHRWVGDELVLVEEDSYDYSGPVSETKSGGGGERDLTPQELAILDAQLRGMNRGMAFEENVVYPMKERMAGEVEGWGSIENSELAASRAGADAESAIGGQRAALEGDLASMGINPESDQYVKAKERLALQGQGQKAAGMTGAREQRAGKGMEFKQAFLTGNPINGSYSQNAASMAGQQGNAVRAGNAADSQGWYNTMMGAGQMASLGSNLYFGADGGAVHLEDGGFVHKGIQKFASGGKAMIQDYASMPLPARGQKTPPPPTTGDYAMGLGKTAAGNKAVMSYAKPAVQEAMFKAGLTDTMPASMTQSMSASTVPAAEVGLESAGLEAAGTEAFMGGELGVDVGIGAEAAGTAAAEAAAAEAAALAAAEAAAAGTATAAAGAEAGAVAGSVVPGVGTLVGAGLGALGGYAMSEWLADGGQTGRKGMVVPGARGRTGEVDGPGGPKDDLIPAMLSDGEYVMPIGAVKYFGLDKLEKMRMKGLEFEKKMGIGKKQQQQRRA